MKRTEQLGTRSGEQLVSGYLLRGFVFHDIDPDMAEDHVEAGPSPPPPKVFTDDEISSGDSYAAEEAGKLQMKRSEDRAYDPAVEE
eukprot:GSA120T00017199001.1